MFMPYGLVPGCSQLWRRWTAPAQSKAAKETASEPAQ
jgi:hypothetical protein